MTDCSKTGVGLFAAQQVRPHTILLLCTVPGASGNGAQWPAEAGRFHMISAEVRWCQPWTSPDGRRGFRIGAKRLMPAC
jgi:hypothetical protein